MPHSERTYRDEDYRLRDRDRYTEERSRKSYPSSGRSSADFHTEHSRPSSVSVNSYPNLPASAHRDVDSSPFYPPKETFSEKCSNLCSSRGIPNNWTADQYRSMVSWEPDCTASFVIVNVAYFQENMDRIAASEPIYSEISAIIVYGAYSKESILQFVEIILSILLLICVGAAQASVSGFTSMGGMGSFNIDSFYSPFEGTELQQVRDLDMQYNQMRAPCVYGGIAFGLTMMCLTLLFLITGGKPIHRLSVRTLIAECIFDILACLGYIVAVGLYLHFVIQVNSTDVCKRRARLYARQGYTSMNCEVQGGDASVALFGLLAACLYCPSAVLSILTIRRVQEHKKQVAKSQYNLDRASRKEDFHNVYKSPESTLNARTFATLV